MAPPGDAHAFPWKLFATLTESGAGIMSVDIIPYDYPSGGGKLTKNVGKKKEEIHLAPIN